MTGAKENEVEVRTPAAGDNSQLALPAPDDFQHHYKAIKGCKDKQATAASLLKHAKEAANKSSPGLAKMIENTIAIERQNDPAALMRHFELIGYGLRQINFPVQLSVFDTLAGDTKEQVYKRGFADGESARTANNKYPAGSDLAAEYDRGYRHGTSKNLGVTPEESDAAMSDPAIAAAVEDAMNGEDDQDLDEDEDEGAELETAH